MRRRAWVSGSRPGSAAARAAAGEQYAQRAARRGQRPAQRGGQACHHAPRTGHRDLLADDGADGELGAVDRAGHTPARRGGHERGKQRVAGKSGIDGPRIGVQVEERATAADRGGEVAQVDHPEAALDVVGARRELGHSLAVRQQQGAPIALGVDLFEAGDGAGREEPQQAGGVEGFTAGQAQQQVAGLERWGGRAGARVPPPRARRRMAVGVSA